MFQRQRQEGYRHYEGQSRTPTTRHTGIRDNAMTAVLETPPPHGDQTLLGSLKLPLKWLSPAEIREMREKGLCFSCDEKYNINHRCKNRVLLMCGEDEIEESQEEEAPTVDEGFPEEEIEVSLNTLSNSVNPRIF